MPQSNDHVRQSFELPGGRIAVFKFAKPDQLSIEITPAPMFGDRDTSLTFLRAYFKARRDFLEIIATVTGLRISVVDELAAGIEAVGEPIAPAARQ